MGLFGFGKKNEEQKQVASAAPAPQADAAPQEQKVHHDTNHVDASGNKKGVEKAGEVCEFC